MQFKLRVWRQAGPNEAGRFETYEADGINPNMSFLELLDVVNERLIGQGREPIAFDHDCREGICGMCSLIINGIAHGPDRATTTCQVYMRRFRDGDTLTIEPWRARPFPVIKDLVVDRSAFDRVIAAGGFVSAGIGSAPDANSIPIAKASADRAFSAAACIGCGACVAACPNASAVLFVGAKITHLGLLPQGQPERYNRVKRMVAAMDQEGFGGCTNHGECEAVCPAEIRLEVIAKMNRDLIGATLRRGREPS